MTKARHGISTGIAVSVIVIIIVIAAIGGAYYYYYAPGTTTKVQVQTFKFGFLHTEDPSHALAVDALNHMSQFNMKAQVVGISDPTSLTSATSQGQVDMFAFQFPTTTINAIEAGANVIGVGAESTSFLQDLVVSTNITTFQQLNGTTMAAFDLDGPVLFPLVWAANGLNYSQYNIHLVVIGESPVKAQGLIAEKYVGAFLDPADVAQVFKSVPGKFHILTSTASAFPGIGGMIFANKNFLNSHFQTVVDFDIAMLQSARNATHDLKSWINSTWQANFTGVDLNIYNTTQVVYSQADYFSPNMIIYTPTVLNASDNFMFYGHLINSSGNVYQIYNFSAAKAALKALGAVQEPSGPFSNSTQYPPLSSIIPTGLGRTLSNMGLISTYAVWYVRKTD